MKKLAIFFFCIIVIVAGMSYFYISYIAKQNEAKRENWAFESYYKKDIYGAELTTIINKALDNNEKNEVQKDKKGYYIDNGKNSIIIELKMMDTDETYKMEKIAGGGMSTFVQYYNEILFRCMEIKYHKETGKVKYILFEQITE